MLQWAHMMWQRCVNQSVLLRYHYLVNTLAKTLLGCIGMTADNLAILKNTSGPEVEKLKKKVQKLFKEKDLDIIVQCHLKITNYLHITLNLNVLYRPYRNPNEETNYIHVNSDHPPSIIKEIP